MLQSYFNKNGLEVGCDEAGRGCLAGPVFAAAVILPKDFSHAILTDSKLLSETKRRHLREFIEANAIAFAVRKMTPREIDKYNILNASIRSMHKALDALEKPFNRILVDGNKFIPYKNIEHHCIIKGDGKFYSIAAASILAKTYRDEYMERMHKKHPEYGWNTNKGYPTKDHRCAITKHGPCKLHRKSFQLLPAPLQGELFK